MFSYDGVGYDAVGMEDMPTDQGAVQVSRDFLGSFDILAPGAVSVDFAGSFNILGPTLVSADFVGQFDIQSNNTVPDVTILAINVPDVRWIKFAGTNRNVVFEGTNRNVVFEGTSRVVPFQGNDRKVIYK